MLTKLLHVLSHVFFMKEGLTEIKEDDSEDTPCDKRKETRFKHFKMGSKWLDTIPVTNAIKNS